jgi:membrane-associated protease RseP (regulator of RpoE activity)
MKSRSSRFLSRVAIFALGCLLASPVAAQEKDKAKSKRKIKVIKKFDCGHGDCPKAGDPEGDFHRWVATKKHGYLGVHLVRITPELRSHFGVSKEAGVMIGKVEEKSPASRAGLKVGDILVEIDGEKVESAWQLQRHVGKKKSGDKARLKVVRDRNVHWLTATIEEKERTQIEVSKFIHQVPDGEEEYHFEFDPGPFDEAIQQFNEHLFQKGEKGLLKFQEFEGDLEKRIEEVEEKLKTLEKKLQGKTASENPRRST